MSAKVTTSTPNDGFPETSFKQSPLMHVRWLFIRFVQGLFYSAPPGQMHWEPGTTSEIVITDENPLQVSEIGNRPGVTFTRGPVQFFGLGLDDLMGYDFATGQKVKSVLVPGTMSINCISRNDIESEQIAWVINEHLWLLREKLLQQGFFELGRQNAIGAPSKAGSLVAGDSGDEWYVTTVMCPFQFYRTSQTTPLNKKTIQNIMFALRSETSAIRQGEFADPNSHEVPVEITTQAPPAFSPAADAYGGSSRPGGVVTELPLVPHPLNPAVKVTLRSTRPFAPALRPPSIGGRVLPLSEPTVEESNSTSVVNTYKV